MQGALTQEPVSPIPQINRKLVLRLVLGIFAAFGVIVTHLALSWTIGIHGVILAAWIFTLAILVGIPSLAFAFGRHRIVRQETRRPGRSVWGPLRRWRYPFQLATLAAKLLGVLWLPVLVQWVWLWNLVDLVTIVTCWDVELRNKKGDA